jgi:hypothetical protein
MPGGFKTLRFHVAEKGEEDLRAVGTRSLTLRGVGRPRPLAGELGFNNDEAAFATRDARRLIELVIRS